jgi:Fe-S oxidoreductase
MLGFLEDAVEICRKNVDLFKEVGASKIITACADCYWMIKVKYPEIDERFNFEVLHISEVVSDLLLDEKVKFGEVNLRATYHDPCFLSRYMSITEEPRVILKHIPNMEFVEMEHNREETMCCGFGGGFSFTFEDLAKLMSAHRVKEAFKVNADIIVTACPICAHALSITGVPSLMPVLDLPELLATIIV